MTEAVSGTGFSGYSSGPWVTLVIRVTQGLLREHYRYSFMPCVCLCIYVIMYVSTYLFMHVYMYVPGLILDWDLGSLRSALH